MSDKNSPGLESSSADDKTDKKSQIFKIEC